MAVKLCLIQKRLLINKFFLNMRNTLKIDKDKRCVVETNNAFDPVLKAIKKYSAHPSILNIKKR